MPEARIVEAGEVLRFRQVDPIRFERIREDPSVLHRLDADTSRVHALGLASRPGVVLFATLLEHRHFNPLDRAREPLLEHRHVTWMGLMFGLFSIPFAEWGLFAEVAASAGLRVADGVPTAIGAEGVSLFPMRSSRVCTLENVGLAPGPGTPGYREALEAEGAECEAIRAATVRRYDAIRAGN